MSVLFVCVFSLVFYYFFSIFSALVANKDVIYNCRKHVNSIFCITIVVGFPVEIS